MHERAKRTSRTDGLNAPSSSGTISGLPASRKAVPCLLLVLMLGVSAPVCAQNRYASAARQAPDFQPPRRLALAHNLEKLNRVVSVHLDSVSVKEALLHLSDLGAFRLALDEEAIPAGRTVTLHLEEATLLEALHATIRGTESGLKLSPSGHLVLVRRPPEAHPPAPAEPAARPAGAVVGRVVEEGTGAPLPGAHIRIDGTPLGAAATRNGTFRLADLPPGTWLLTTSYLGYETHRTRVDVEADQTTEVEIRLAGRVLETSELLVHGLREGQVRALAQKRDARNLKDVLAADAIGKLPDQNVAEAVQRVPGITIQTDRGEGRFVFIRGTEPNLNTVTINGQNLASTAESRATALDLLPSEMLSSIEVVKSVTPDMDGETLGGTINIHTLSAFDRPGPFLFGSVYGLMHQRTVDYGARKLPYQAHATAGRLFGPRKQWGLVVSGSASRRAYTVSRAHPDDWRLLNGRFVPEEFETEVEDTRRDRYGLNANLDFRPSDRTALYLRTYYARTDELNDQAEYIFELTRGNLTRQTATSGRIDAGAGGLDLELTDLDEYLYAASLGGEQRFAGFTWSADATYTRGVLDRFTRKPEFTSGARPDFSFGYDVGGAFTALSFDHPAAVGDPANYVFGEIDLEYESNVENTWTATSDLRRDIEIGRRPGFLQAGIKLRRRAKTIDDLEKGFAGGAAPATLALHPLPPPSALQGGGALPVLGDTEALFGFFERHENNPHYFTYDASETLAEGVENDSNNSEDVHAAYAMGSADLGRLTVLAGLRVERTATESRRWQLFTDRDRHTHAVGAQGFENHYVNLLPSLHFKYTPAPDLVLRAAWSNTIGRPDYEELAGVREVTFLQVDPGVYKGRVEEGNPALKPFEAVNLDASAEYYFSLGGLLAVSAFYKSIDNPIYESERTERDVAFEGLFFREIDFVQDRNADAGTIRGLEASYQQWLLFLPPPLNGLGLSANVAFIDSHVDVPGREADDLPFFGQSDLVYNVIPYFQRGGLEMRVALSFQSAYLAYVGREAYQDVYGDDRLTIDLTGSYALRGDRLKLTAQIRNLTNEPERAFQNVRSRYVQHALTGRTFMLGISTAL